MAEGAVGGGGVPIIPIITEGIRLGLHEHEALDPVLLEQISASNSFVLEVAEEFARQGGGQNFGGTTTKELIEYLIFASGMCLIRLAEFLGVIPPIVEGGSTLLVTGPEDVHAELDFTDSFISTQGAFPLPELLDTLAHLLLQPSRVPGEPCLAPAPLLKDLLDLALGRFGGVIGDILREVGGSVQDLLIPAFATGQGLNHSIQAILDDPITAALNLAA